MVAAKGEIRTASARIRYDFTPMQGLMIRLKFELAKAIQADFAGPMQDALRVNTARYAPTPEEEEQILVRGRITKPWGRFLPLATNRVGRAMLNLYGKHSAAGFGMAGTSQGRRFFREGQQVSLVEALGLQKVRVHKARIRNNEVRVSGSFASWKHLATRTKFSYVRHKRRGSVSTETGKLVTKPFNEDWPRAANYGGTWVVVPRARGGRLKGVLHPEDGVYALEMVKTVRPYRFMEKGVRRSVRWWITHRARVVFALAAHRTGLVKRAMGR